MSREEPPVNAIITEYSLAKSEHGMLTMWLTLDYGDGLHQGFGGYSLYLDKTFKNHSLASFAGHFISRCLEVAGVDDIKDLPGKAIRVKCSAMTVSAIGHIIKTDWFCPKEDLEKMIEEDPSLS